jgi:hypothetical protein
MAEKPVTITIWTDFEVPSTRQCATAGHAFDLGDNALRNLGCDRYTVSFVNGAAAVARRRVWRDGAYALGDYYTPDRAA